MGEFFKSTTGIGRGAMRRGGSEVSKPAPCRLTGVTALVWDRNESLVNDGHKPEVSSVDGLRGRRRSRQRSSRDRRAPAVEGKLKKKLASLEESGTKTKSATGCPKQKTAQMRKK